MNILFIMADALRPDRLGCYGYHRKTSPNIDKLAAGGVVFENFIATASQTLPPVISYLTGLDTASHKIVNQESFLELKTGARSFSPSPLEIIAENSMVVDGELVMRWGPLGFSKDTPTEKITDYFEENRPHDWVFFAEPYNTHLPYNPPENYFEYFLENHSVSNETKKRIETVKSKLIVHPSNCVSKLEAGEEDAIPDDDSDESHKRTFGIVDLMPEDKHAIDALYDGEVKVFDDLVGKYLKKLEELNILDKTLIIITSDHGEELMERGHVGHCSCNLNGTLYDESIKVPMIIYYPAMLPKGKTIPHQASQIDIMPTLFDILGLKMAGHFDGESVLPLILGKSNKFRKEAYSESAPAGWQALSNDKRNMWAARTNKYKLILKTDYDFSFRKYELYDLQLDPEEQHNIHGKGCPEEEVLLSKLNEYILKASELQHNKKYNHNDN